MLKMLKIFALLWCVSAIIGVIADDTEEPEIYRLPGNIEPLSYDLRIIPNLEKFNFNGKVTINILVQYTTDVIQLHSKNLLIKGPQVFKQSNTDRVPIKEFHFDEKNDLLIISLTDSMTYGSTYTLNLDFEGVMSDGTNALYATFYKINEEKRWLAVTHFFGTHAREVFPCFDEPRFKASFTISISKMEKHQTLSNTCHNGKHDDRDHRSWDEYKKSPLMPTYSVAFMIHPPDFTDASKPDTMITIRALNKIEQYTQYALIQSEKILKLLQEFFGISLKSCHLLIVALPKVNNEEISHSGVIMLREKLLITDERNSAELHKTAILSALTKHLSRQWFDGMVTPASWDYMWLIDAFAGYVEILIIDEMKPLRDFAKLRYFQNQQMILWEEVSQQRALTTPINTISSINEKYNLVSLHKGTSIIRMLEHIISKNSLRSVINKYLNNGYNEPKSLVTPEIFFQALEHQAVNNRFSLPPHVSIKDIMKTWTENVGYPLINVIRDPSTNKVTIEQTTYISKRADTPPPNEEWIVPISYTVKSEAQFSNTKPQLWSFANKIVRLPKPLPDGDWIICNLQQSAYYRVNYDTHNWNLLIEQLKEDPQKIHVLNRAQLIDDAFALAYNDTISYDIPLRLGEYLKDETEPIPLLSALFHLDMLYSKYEYSRNRVFFCIYISKIFEKQFERIGFDVKSTDSYSTKIARSAILSLLNRIGWTTHIQHSLKEYQKNIQDISKVQADLKEVVFCTVMSYTENPQIEYENIWSAYQTSNMDYDRITLLKALGCAKDEALIKRLLSKIMDSNDEDIATFDTKYIIRSILSRPAGVTAVLQFFRDQVPTITKWDYQVRLNLKTILQHLESKVQSERNVRLLHILRRQYGELDQQIFGDFTKAFQRVRSAAIKRIRENNKKSEHMDSMFHDILKITRIQPSPPRILTSSASATSVFTFFSYICFVIYFRMMLTNVLH